MFHQYTLKSVYTGTEKIKPFIYIKKQFSWNKKSEPILFKKELPGYFLCYGRANALKYI